MPAEPLSQVARSLGIAQSGATVLQQPAAPFDLPGEAAKAARLLAQLTSTLDQFAALHDFTSGLGLSAPQLGITRAAAVIHVPNGQCYALLNPRIIAQSADTDEDYEGCLSFYDVRGLVTRPVTLHIEHQNLDGQYTVTEFPHGLARLAAHEIDHLRGLLYTDRMPAGLSPIEVRPYRRAPGKPARGTTR